MFNDNPLIFFFSSNFPVLELWDTQYIGRKTPFPTCPSPETADRFMPVFYRSMPSSDFTDCRCAALKADIFAIFFDAWYQMIAATYALQDRSLYAMGIEGRTVIKALLTTLAEEEIETTLTEETESGRLHVHLIELLEHQQK